MPSYRALNWNISEGMAWALPLAGFYALIAGVELKHNMPSFGDWG